MSALKNYAPLKISHRKPLHSKQILTEHSRTFMNHVENGKRNISVGTLEKIICNGLETSFKEFFEVDAFTNGKRRVRK